MRLAQRILAAAAGAAPLYERIAALKQGGDRVPIPSHSGDVIAQRAAGYTVQMAALVVIGQGQVGTPDRFPKPHLVAPFGLAAGAGRDPRIDADRCRVT